jgi:hypothetical protein
VKEGLIKLDVVVTDKSGKPVTGLKPADFNVLDAGQPRNILSFQAFDGISARPDPPVEVVLVIDTVGMPALLASFEREDLEKLLRRNGGHLAQPFSIFRLSREAGFDNLDRKVLAVQSGGRVLEASHDLDSQIDGCVEEASSFYALSFDPAHADQPNEYHDLKIQVSTPGLTARSDTGYYDQPYYQDQPNPAVRRVTVKQLEQVLEALRGKSDREVARQLSKLELTERLSDTKLSSWTVGLRGAKARQSLVALADVSAFLAPPAAEVLADAPPDPNAQQSIISLAVDYLNEAIPKLPNFFATRTTVRYVETPPHDEGSGMVENQPLHMVDSGKATVLYRRGYEVVDSKAKEDKRRLTTYGTFGPILGVTIDAVAAREGFTWSRWEQGAGRPRAIFRYVIPVERSHFQVTYCCLPDGDGEISFQKLQGYHGEIAIDPASGAILRLTMEADLNPALPLVRSGILVKYGPVEIGGKTYICPVKSVSISRSRTVSVLGLTGWDESFRTYGPFATSLNDVAFDDYHIFRAESHVLNDVPLPEDQ